MNQITGTSIIAFKVRVRNSDIPTGKSGGYRLIYQLRSPNSVFLLTVYAKSDRSDVSINELVVPEKLLKAKPDQRFRL